MAFHQCANDGEITSDEAEAMIVTPQQPQPKKQRFADPTLALLESLIAPSATAQASSEKITPYKMARQEIEYYRNIPKETWPNFEETIPWWQS